MEWILPHLEGSAKGILVNPFCMEKEGISFLKEGLSLKVDKGKVVEIDGGIVAKQLLEFLEQIGESGRNIAELGISTNPKCRLSITIREMKKSWGDSTYYPR